MSNSLSSTRDLSEKWRVLLPLMAVVVAIEIALHSFIVKEPVLTLIGATLWLAGAFWTRRGRRVGPWLIGVLAALEISATLFFSEEFAGNSQTASWILYLHVALVAVALVMVVMTLRDRSRVPSVNRSQASTV